MNQSGERSHWRGVWLVGFGGGFVLGLGFCCLVWFWGFLTEVVFDLGQRSCAGGEQLWCGSRLSVPYAGIAADGFCCCQTSAFISALGLYIWLSLMMAEQRSLADYRAALSFCNLNYFSCCS